MSPDEASSAGGDVLKASSRVAARLRNQILGDGLLPGDRLCTEADLIKREGVSRATAREALRILEAEDLVTIRRGPSGGIFVRHPTMTQVAHSLTSLLTLRQAPLRDVFEFRLATEPFASSLAARRARPEQVATLVQLAENPSDESDVQFHLALAEATNNEAFRVLLGSLVEVIRLHAPRETVTELERAQTAAVHQRIAAAIESGDGDEAARLTQSHIAAFSARMEELGRLSAPIIPRHEGAVGRRGPAEDAAG